MKTERKPYRLPHRPRLFESFAGVGMQRMAFERLGIEYEMIGISEIDKHAIQSYMAIHGETKNFGDITKIKGEDLPPIDVFTYSFPCQDLSVAGKGRGLGDGTRSGLVLEVLRILQELKELDRLPQVLIMENVLGLISKKHMADFEEIQRELVELGYTNHWDKLNAKDYGVAQSRNRVFMISVLGDYDYSFPKQIPLEKRLKDYLEPNVDKKYYIKNTDGLAHMMEKNISNTIRSGGRGSLDKHQWDVIVEPVNENYGVLIGGKWDKMHDISRRVYNTESTAPTVHTMGGGNQELKIVEPICLNPKVDGKQPSLADRVYDDDGISTAVTCGWMPSVLVKEATQKGYAEAHVGDSINLEQPNLKTRRGRVGRGVAQTLTTSPQQAVVELPCIAASRGRNPDDPSDRTTGAPTEQHLEINPNGWSNTLTTVQKDNYVIEPTARIRKLTPLECWRLMGIDDECFHRAKASGVSNSQLYKQAGNGLVVDVFAALLSTMTNEQREEENVTVKELIDFLTWCDDTDKPIKIVYGGRTLEITRADESDDEIVLSVA